MGKPLVIGHEVRVGVDYQHLSEEYQAFFGGCGSSFCDVSVVEADVSCSGRLVSAGGLLCGFEDGSSCGIPAAAFFRASTTRRTMTAWWSAR